MPPPRLSLAQRASVPQPRAAQPNENAPISKTAIAFLVPLFLFFIFGPITFIVILKRRRGAGNTTTIRLRDRVTGRPAKITREQARSILEGCTEVLRVGQKAMNGGDEVRESSVEGDAGKDGPCDGVDAGSVLERECAICLTALYGPSPPTPAKLPIKIATKSEDESTVAETEQAEEQDKENGSDAEVILRLTVCSHEFHAECLTGWFIFGKFSCPICRAIFYGQAKEEKKEEGGSTETQMEGSQRRSSQSRLPPIEEEEESGRERRGGEA